MQYDTLKDFLDAEIDAIYRQMERVDNEGIKRSLMEEIKRRASHLEFKLRHVMERGISLDPYYECVARAKVYTSTEEGLPDL